MDSKLRVIHAAVTAALVAGLVAGGALAAQPKGGKIVCWKDKSGKVVGCGDRVPPEYQDAATKVLDRRGVTRKTTESAEERAKAEAARQAREKETAQQQAEEKRRIEEQRRQDMALINTFSNEKEIDLKRDRDISVVDTQLTQLRIAHKNALAHQAEAKKAGQKEEMARADANVAKSANAVAEKEKEREELRQRYTEMRKRYMELKGGGSKAAARK